MRLRPISRKIVQIGLTALCLSIIGTSADANRCGGEVQVKVGETLSTLAERCEITEARILDLNPGIKGSKDLKAGMRLDLVAEPGEDATTKMREAADSLLGRLKSYASGAGRTIDRAADTVERSVEEFIQRNPDLHQRVRKLGERLNIPGMERVEAQVSLSARRGGPGTPVTLSAIGLPANQRVEIAGGAPGSDYQIIETARTSAEGTLQVTVELPLRAEPNRDFIFVIAIPESNLAVRSAAFDVQK